MLTKETDEEEIGEDSGTPGWLLLLLIAGLILVLVGVLVVFALGFSSGGSSSTGIVIFIGPIPIVFGSGPNAGLLILIGVIIAAVSVALFVIMRRRMLVLPNLQAFSFS
jgi:uncharacterized membrane protein